MQSLMLYAFHFNIFKLVSELPLMAGCNKRSLIIERVMLIGFLLCMGVIPFCLCLDNSSGGGSKVGGSCIESERRALLAIRADIYDPDDWLSSWMGQDCCQWRGVGCDSTSGHVVKLNLRYPYDLLDAVFYETRKFPQPSKVNPSISSLIYLRYLDLSMNNFFGAPIPKFIGSLMHLEYLNLSMARFCGPIPRQIGNLSSLHYLNLESGPYINDLHVNDLQWLSRIPSLQYLDLSFVDLSKASNWLHEINMHPSLSVLKLHYTGLQGIPSTLQHVNFTSLTMLDLSSNYFQSTIIPDWLFNISSLVELHLDGCNIHGRLSTVEYMLGNLNRLKHLDISWNQITGDISHTLWNNKHMEYLDLSINKITGHTIEMLGNLSQLRYLSLSVNQISGKIPENLGNFSHLEILHLSENIISGEIPKSMGNLCNLEELYLSFNQITGWIPEEIFEKHSQLRILDLGSNQISGEILQNLRNLSHLEILYLSNNIISGEIRKSMGNLCNLEELDLSFNQITGWIPEEILGNHSRMRSLYLGGNQITGEILKNLRDLSHLENLYLFDNKISGEIPETIGNLAHLQHLHLANNNFTGKIPENMSMLCNLQELYLSNNNIGGEITGLIEGFSKYNNNKLDWRSCGQTLRVMYMGNNKFSGTIPESVGQLSSLMWLNLSLNTFTGYVTEVHFSNLISLAGLDLSYNSLKMNLSDSWIPSFNATYIGMCSCYVGPKFPAWLRTQTYLRELCLSEAGISEKIPSWLWYKDFLYFLNVSHNCMEGQLSSFSGSRNYGFLDLSSNCFSGPIPNIKAKYMILSNNSFSGPIPLSFSENVDYFTVLSLSNNHINGNIPQFLYNWTSLKVLDLSNNELTGEFPDCQSKSQPENKRTADTSSEVAYPINLQSLHMSNNSLSGKFPSFLRLCKQLVVLDLGENRFSGNIPTWIGESLSYLRVLRLRSNYFDGNIPRQISSLSSLQVLDLAYNSFSGNLPPSFGNFSAMVRIQEGSKPIISNYTITTIYKESLLIFTKGLELEYTSVLLLVRSIDLSHNNLSGEVPNEVTNLHGLQFLNLSGNHFIGKIPQNLGDMRQLESLDLSMNNLSGQIPQTMLALTYLSHLNLSYNNLSGRIPSGNQFLTYNDPSIYIGNHNLCGQPLPDCPTNASPHQEEEEVDEDDYETIWIYASSALGFVMGFWGFVGMVLIKKDTRIAYLRFLDRIYDCVYTESAIKFAKLKFVMGKSYYKPS